MSNIGYVRVSSIQQNDERQLADIKLDRVFTEKLSGKNTERPQLRAMLDFIREGDTVHVHELSRLARNAKDALTIIDDIKAKGCSIWIHKENIKLTGENDMVANLMLSVLAGVAQMEREMMLSRQAEGYAAKAAQGLPLGRGKSQSVDRVGIVSALASGSSIRETAKAFGVGVSTVQRIKKEQETL